LSVLTYTYLYSPFLPNIWPRTNYRRDVSSGVVLFVWCLCFVLVGWDWCVGFWAAGGFDIRCILYYYIIIYYILYYYILYYTHLFCSYLLLSSLPSSSSSLLPYIPLIHSISWLKGIIHLSIFRLRIHIFYQFILYLSVLTYTYLYSFPIYLPSHTLPPKYLTPHKLSEGCLEWCSFISIGLCCLAFELVDGWGV
jgi:hypothetical protein